MAENKDETMKKGREKDMIESDRAFDDLLMETTEDTLEQILGQTTAKAILFHLERSMGMKRKEFSHKVEGFSSGLNDILGPGASFVEDLILKRLYSKFQVEYDSEHTFEGHLQRLRKSFKLKKEEGKLGWEKR